jgi:hypothetical protein
MVTALVWLGVLLGLFGLGRVCIVQAYEFLAVNAPIEADVLVVEGWLPDYALEEVAVEWRQGTYQKIITLGEPLRHGYFLSQYKSYATLAAATLSTLGVDSDRIVAIPFPLVERDRTKTSALYLQAWLQEHDPSICAINLYSLGPHARRSWFLFRQTLHPRVRVGILSGTPKEYQPQCWWNYSAGVRSMLSEMIGYIYAFIFSLLTRSKAVEGIAISL